MANYKFYTQNTTVSTSTLSAETGAENANFPLDNMLNWRIGSLTKPGTITGGIFAFEIDHGAALSSAHTFCAFVNNDLFTSQTASLTVYTDTTDTFPSPTTVLNTVASVSADEPIWFELMTASSTEQYWKVELSSLASATCYWGCFFMGGSAETFSPSVDPSLPISMLLSRQGNTLQRNNHGAKFVTSKSNRMRVWSFLYEYLSSADMTIFSNLESATYGNQYPLIWTDGTNYYFGRMASEMQIKQPYTVGDLYEVSFSIEEDI